MGGCRCTYRKCANSTDPNQKLHFFHYPVRDPKRCEQWIINARRPDFTDLPADKLRNKVICEYHFEEHCFMNYKHERLIHNAIPTIDTHPEDEMIKTDQPVLPKANDTNTEYTLVSSNGSFTLIPTNSDDSTENDYTLSIENNEGNAYADYARVDDENASSVYFSPDESLKYRVMKVNMPYTNTSETSKNQSKTIIPDAVKVEPDIHIEDDSDDCQQIVYSVSTNEGNFEIFESNERADDSEMVEVQVESSAPEVTTYSICTNKDITNNSEILVKDVDVVNKLRNKRLREDMLKTQSDEISEKPAEKRFNQKKLMIQSEQKRYSSSSSSTPLTKRQLYRHCEKMIGNPTVLMALQLELFHERTWNFEERELAIDFYIDAPEGYNVLKNKWKWNLPPVNLIKQWIRERYNKNSDFTQV